MHGQTQSACRIARSFSQVLGLSVVLLATTAQAQLATHHWIPPQLSLATGTQHLFLSTPIVDPVNVTVTDGTGAVLFSGTVANATPQHIGLGTSNLLTSVASLNQVSTQGLVVVADKPVYADMRHTVQNQGSSLTAKGFSGLGTRFRAGVLREDGSPTPDFRGAFISVMAMDDTTVVTFDDIKPGVVFFGTSPPTTPSFSVTLDQNESYVIGVQATTYAGTAQFDDITGTLITSDKPIAVVSGSWLGGPATNSQDIGVDELVPESLAGTKYVLIRGNAPASARLESPIVVATVDGTTVTVNGNPAVVCTLNAGDYCYLDGRWGTAGQNMLVQSSRPVMMYQMIGGDASEATPGFNVVPPLQGGGTFVVDNIPRVEFLGTPTVGIIAKAGASVTINGSPVMAAAVPVDGDPTFVTYRVLGLTGNISVHSSDFVAVALYSVDNPVGAAGYFSGFPPSLQLGPCDETDVTLYDWVKEDIGSAQGPSNWVVAPDGLTVNQLNNSSPSIFYGPFDAIGTTVSGTAFVTSSGDDDYFGFVLGYLPGDNTNPAADYLIVDWKRNSQFFNFPSPGVGTTAVRGLALSRVTGVPQADELWGHVTQPDTPGGMVELARGMTLGSSPWIDPPPPGSYVFSFEYTATNLRVFVDGVLQIDYTAPIGDTLPAGRIGFYNFSQDNARYSAFGQISVPSVTPPPPLVLPCSPGGIAITDPRIVDWLALATTTGGVDPVFLVNNAPLVFANGCPGVTTVTFTASDLCSRTDSATSTVTLVDNDGPIVDPIPGIAVSCTGPPPPPDIGIVTYTDCNLAVVAFVSDVSDGASCPETIARTYRVTDACGHATDATQTITIDDGTAPVVDPLSDILVECIEDVPAPDTALVTFTDNCIAASMVTYVGDVSDGQSCPETITRTYRVIDGCGNTTDVSQTIVVDDVTPPVVDPLGDVLVECIGDVPAVDPSIVTFSDNCAAASTVTHGRDASDGQSCPETITRSYRVTDGCGNTTDVSQTIVVDDVTPPVVDPLSDVLVQCIEDVPAADPSIVTFSDNCPAASSTSHVGDVSDGQRCPQTITRTYRVTDGCGNSAEVMQAILVDDVTPPVVDPLGDVLVQCIEDVPAANTAIVTYADNCVAASSVIHVGDVSNGQSCPETLTRTYRVADGCGNAVDVTQTIVIDDVTAPVVDPLSDTLVECIEDVPSPDTSIVTFTDNCRAASSVTHTGDVSDGASCPENITRTYRVTDGCGNATDVTQTITVHDVTAPVVDPLSDLLVQCIEDVPVANPAVVTFSDNCLAPSVVTHVSDVSDGASCPQTITRIYRVADGCGNATDVAQNIVVDDTTPPTVPPLPDIAVSCVEDLPPADTGIVVFTDNCLAASSVSHVGDVSDNQFCPTTILRTYRIVDGCGNATEVMQNIVIDDTTGPVITGVPDDETVECDAVPAPAEPSVADNCLIPPTLEYEQEREDGSCEDNYTLTRTWTATDGCGNVTVEIQDITVVDTTVPVVTGILEPTVPRPASSPASACSPASHREFRVICDATDNCDDMPVITAQILAAHTVVGPNSTCMVVVEEIDVACGEVLEIRLQAAPCSATSPTSAHPASSGILVVVAESVTLEVTAVDRCGNIGSDTFDPATDPSTLCDEVLEDGTCCPAIGQPASECEGVCGPGFNGLGTGRSVDAEQPVGSSSEPRSREIAR